MTKKNTPEIAPPSAEKEAPTPASVSSAQAFLEEVKAESSKRGAHGDHAELESLVLQGLALLVQWFMNRNKT